MNIDEHDDDDIMSPAPLTSDELTPVVVPEVSDDIIDEPEVAAEPIAEDDDVVEANVDVEFDEEREGVQYDQTKIDLRGEPRETLRNLINQDYGLIGGPMLDARVKEIGSWENLIFRSLGEESTEDTRVQEALAGLDDNERAVMSHILRDPNTQKTLLRTARITSRGGIKGEKKQLSGDEAILAFENLKSTKGGGYRIPLYNSGISVDVIVPTGNNIQTMITNCLLMDQEMGASQGAHYFAYYDLIYKSNILDFIKPLIINSSYVDWRKQNKLWSIIKLPDLTALIATIGALCYPDGFENFVTRCTREATPEKPDLCRHTETFTANIFEMIMTRWSVMSQSAIEFMTQSRGHAVRHTLSQIAAYQSELGFEGERITYKDVTFIMRIPTVAEHLEAGEKFIADIRNEIQGDNTDGHYAQFGFRAMRVFLPWIGSIEGEGPNGEIFATDDSKTILRQLEKLDQNDEENTLRNQLRDYINRVQLTYVGHPSLPCPTCGHVADTPSGMLTLDPFSAFFTQALLYSKPND